MIRDFNSLEEVIAFIEKAKSLYENIINALKDSERITYIESLSLRSKIALNILNIEYSYSKSNGVIDILETIDCIVLESLQLEYEEAQIDFNVIYYFKNHVCLTPNEVNVKLLEMDNFQFETEILAYEYNKSRMHEKDLLEVFRLSDHMLNQIKGSRKEIRLKDVDLVKELETKTNKLKNNLKENGFYNLSSVKSLTKENTDKLIEMIATNNASYTMAMFDFLGYFKLLDDEYFISLEKRHKAIATWLNVGERTIKGYYYSLKEVTNENKNRYTAHEYKETVKKDYEKLK